MKKVLVLLLFLCVGSLSYASDYYYNNSQMYSKTGESWFNHDYHNPVTYRVEGNDIYGSDGSHYKRSGRQVIHDTAPQSSSYYINGRDIQKMGF